MSNFDDGVDTSRHCSCGSGEERYWLYDSQGIELCTVCDQCESEVKKKYNPWVFSGYDQGFLDEYSGERIEPEEDY